MQLIDILLEGSVILGCGYIATMFVGFFIRTVRPAVEQVDGLSEIAGEDLLQQAEAIPPVMEYVDIFSDDDPIDEEFEYGEDPDQKGQREFPLTLTSAQPPAFPGDVTVTAEPAAVDLADVEPIGRPEARCMGKAMAPEARLTVPVDEHPALEGMSIRQLKKLASEAKIKRYSNLTKDELIERLRRLA